MVRYRLSSGPEGSKACVADFRALFQDGTFPERKALIRNFVPGIEIVDGEATLTYTISMPQDGVTKEAASVLDFVQSGPPSKTAPLADGRRLPGYCTYSPTLAGIGSG